MACVPACGMAAAARMSDHSCQSARESSGRPFSWARRYGPGHEVTRALELGRGPYALL
jgi:hypothetical protein